MEEEDVEVDVPQAGVEDGSESTSENTATSETESQSATESQSTDMSETMDEEEEDIEVDVPQAGVDEEDVPLGVVEDEEEEDVEVDVPQAGVKEQVASAGKNGKSRKWWNIIPFVAAGSGAGIFGFFAAKKRKDKKNK